MKNAAPNDAPVSDRPQLPRAPRRPQDGRRLLNFGRFVCVAVPVFTSLAAGGSLSSRRGIELGVAFTAIWLGALSSSFTAAAKELLALGVLPAAVRGAVFGVIGVSALEFWLGDPTVGVAPVAASAAVIVTLFSLWETIARRQLEPARRVLLVGTGPNAAMVVQEVRSAHLPFEVIGMVGDGVTASPEPAGAPILGDVVDLPRLLEEHLPDLVVLAVERDRPTTFGYLLESASTGFRVLELPQFYEHALGRVPVRDLSRAWFMSVLHLYQRPHSKIAKRMFDVVVAALGLVLMGPSIVLTLLLVRRSRGPIILRQTRIGEHGRSFTIYKFRTMREDAEAEGEALWASTHDPRITPEGELLRRLRLDELPQLWNVLRGDMSIVGPRPERPEFLARLQEEVPYWTRRHLVKPGVTGWAQIRRGYTADIDGSMDKLSFDLWYLRHRSLLVDLTICVRTIGMLLMGTRDVVDARPAVTPPPVAAPPVAAQPVSSSPPTVA